MAKIIDGTDNINNAITSIEINHDLRVDSSTLANNIGIQHKNAIALVDNNKLEFEELGRLAFETRKGEQLIHGGFAKSTRIALLNEDQSYFLLTLTRNTKRTKALKVNLVKSFSRFRKNQQSEADYLPFYHELHDKVRALSDRAHQDGSLTSENLFHITYNKLINKAFGLKTGQRSELSPRLRAKLTAANIVAEEVIQQCIFARLNHKATYQKVKQAIFAIAEPIKIEKAGNYSSEVIGKAA